MRLAEGLPEDGGDAASQQGMIASPSCGRVADSRYQPRSMLASPSCARRSVVAGLRIAGINPAGTRPVCHRRLEILGARTLRTSDVHAIQTARLETVRRRRVHVRGSQPRIVWCASVEF